MNTYSIDRLQPLTLGRVGDHGIAHIPIDCSAWMNKYPTLTSFYIQAVTPSGVTYIPDTTMEGDVLIWNITEQDTAQAGYGEYWVVAEGADGMKKKSASPPFIVLGTKQPDTQGGDSNTGDSNCECDNNALREELTALVADAESAADRAEDAASRAADTAEATKADSALAEDAAERAKVSAGDAELSATSSQDAVNLVAETAVRADEAAAKAEASAAIASGAAATAENAADEAEASAEAAKKSADLAQGSTGDYSNVLVIHGGGAVFPEG